jgi:hypothetical protein
MAMFLTILFVSLLVVFVNCILFASLGNEKKRPEIRPEAKIALDPPKFFAGDLAPAADPARIPIEMLLSQIERHVRLEQAAAESFLEGPTTEALHSHPAPPVLN